MKKRIFISILCSVLTVSGIMGSAISCSAAETETDASFPTVTGNDMVTANTYIGPDGQVLDSLSFESSNDALTDADVAITFRFAPVDYLGETESRYEDAVIESVEASDGMVTVNVSDVPYATLEDVTVSCTDEALNCGLGDFKVSTRTVDEFVQDTFTAQDGTELSYYLYMPESDSALPLMVWEHGGGEVLASAAPGANLRASRGAVAWIENGFETAVLSVQYPENYSFGISEIPEELAQMEAFGTAKFELIQKLIEDGKVDASRVYISGASSGAGAALRMIIQYPDLFAAALVVSAKDTIVPISQKYDLAYKFGDNSLLEISDEDYQDVYAAMEEALDGVDISSTPIWFVQALHDQICTSYTSSIMFDILEKKGAESNKLTLYTDEEMEAAGQHGAYHGSWAVALEDMDMLNWVYEQSR